MKRRPPRGDDPEFELERELRAHAPKLSPEEQWASMPVAGRIEAARGMIAEGIERLIEAKLERAAVDLPYYDQDTSPLGRRRHLELARIGAFNSKKIGRRVLVLRRELDNYIAAHGLSPKREEDDESYIAIRDKVLGRRF